MKKGVAQKAAIAGLIVTGCTLSGLEATQAKEIHCKGVSTKWVNDCAANGHECAMHATSNFDAKEWVKLEESDCTAVKNALKNAAVKKYIERIQTGTVTAVKRGKKF